MTLVTCGECGIAFTIPEARFLELKRKGSTFYCPNGHRRHFVVKPDEKDLKIEHLRELMRDNNEKFVAVIEERNEWRERCVICIICGEKVARRNAAPATMQQRMLEHLGSAHGARHALRALPAAGESSG